MDPELQDFTIADVVISKAGRDQGKLFYVLQAQDGYLVLADGKIRRIEKPKRKKQRHVQKFLRSETRVAQKLRAGDKVLNSELRRDLAYLSQEL